MPKNHFKNLGVGLGLRVTHYDYIFTQKPKIDFFEIISENFMVDGGPPLKNLDKILEVYKVVQHGVSMNIASADDLDFEYLKRLKALTKITKTPWFSDHLCWSKSNGHSYHDLLPVPYTEKNALFIANKARIVQDYLELPFALENLSTYISFKNSEMSEWDFYKLVVEEAGCYMLLDLNNIYVSSVNHHFSAKDYLDSIPWYRVAQVHLAGPSLLDDGTMLDTHNSPVLPEVWSLYSETTKHTNGISTLIEWDEDIPEFEVLLKEVQKAKAYNTEPTTVSPPIKSLKAHQHAFGQCISLPLILEDDGYLCQYENFNEEFILNVNGTSEKDPLERIATYNEQYWFRLIEVMQSEYPFLCEVLGFQKFNKLIVEYIAKYPSQNYSLTKVSQSFVKFIKETEKWDTGPTAQIAELEYIFIKIFDQAESIYHFESLKTISPDNTLSIDESLHLFKETWNLIESYQNFKSEKDDIEINPSEGYWFINRLNNSYNIRKISPCQSFVLSLLKEGKALDVAFENLDKHFKKDEIDQFEDNLKDWFYELTLLGVFINSH